MNQSLQHLQRLLHAGLLDQALEQCKAILAADPSNAPIRQLAETLALTSNPSPAPPTPAPHRRPTPPPSADAWEADDDELPLEYESSPPRPSDLAPNTPLPPTALYASPPPSTSLPAFSFQPSQPSQPPHSLAGERPSRHPSLSSQPPQPPPSLPTSPQASPALAPSPAPAPSRASSSPLPPKPAPTDLRHALLEKLRKASDAPSSDPKAILAKALHAALLQEASRAEPRAPSSSSLSSLRPSASSPSQNLPAISSRSNLPAASFASPRSSPSQNLPTFSPLSSPTNSFPPFLPPSEAKAPLPSISHPPPPKTEDRRPDRTPSLPSSSDDDTLLALARSLHHALQALPSPSLPSASLPSPPSPSPSSSSPALPSTEPPHPAPLASSPLSHLLPDDDRTLASDTSDPLASLLRSLSSSVAAPPDIEKTFDWLLQDFLTTDEEAPPTNPSLLQAPSNVEPPLPSSPPSSYAPSVPDISKEAFEDLFQHALGAYLRKDTAQALLLFEECLRFRPDDKRVLHNLERLRKRKTGP